jgi:hypothetical protein
MPSKAISGQRSLSQSCTNHINRQFSPNPLPPCLSRQHHRLAIMHLSKRAIGIGSKNCEARNIHMQVRLIQPSHEHRLSIGSMKKVRLFTTGRYQPLIPAIRRNQASSRLPCLAELGFHCSSFHSCIDRLLSLGVSAHAGRNPQWSKSAMCPVSPSWNNNSWRLGHIPGGLKFYE